MLKAMSTQFIDNITSIKKTVISSLFKDKTWNEPLHKYIDTESQISKTYVDNGIDLLKSIEKLVNNKTS